MTDGQLEEWITGKMYDPHAETRKMEEEVKEMARDYSPEPSKL